METNERVNGLKDGGMDSGVEQSWFLTFLFRGVFACAESGQTEGGWLRVSRSYS